MIYLLEGLLLLVGLSYLSIVMCNKVKALSNFASKLSILYSAIGLFIVSNIILLAKVKEFTPEAFGRSIGYIAGFFTWTSLAAIFYRLNHSKERFSSVFKKASLVSFLVWITVSLFTK